MKPAKNEISVSTLRDELPHLLARVAFNGETFTIMKHGKKYATIRPFDEGDEERIEAAVSRGGRKRKAGTGS